MTAIKKALASLLESMKSVRMVSTKKPADFSEALAKLAIIEVLSDTTIREVEADLAGAGETP